MLTNIQGKNVQITDAMRERADKKLSVLDKYFKDADAIGARLLVKIYNDHHKVEVTVDAPIGLLRAEVREKDFYNALDRVVDKLEDQIRRQKTKYSKKQREKLSIAFLENMEKMEETSTVETKPVRTKTIVATKLDLTTAIMNMELLNHDFYVYTDDETDEVAVVYRRVDGGYGLLEIEKE